MILRRLAPLALFALVACSRDAASPVAPLAACPSSTIPKASALSEGLDTAALRQLYSEAQAQSSEALIVLRNGKLVYEDYFGFPNNAITAMSASKSFISLAFGFLLGDGKLTSLDTRVVDLFPGFDAVDARKTGITIRHLLTHTSGIGPGRSSGSTGDILGFAVASQNIFDPGAGWQYSNNGVDFLAAVAGKLAGEPVDAYLDRKLFCPLGITSATWVRDSKGVPLGAGEMSIRPLDLAKVGQMLLDGGVWNGQQIVKREWIDSSWAASQPHYQTNGLLWWRSANGWTIGITNDLIAQWRGNGLVDSTASKLQSLSGVTFTTSAALNAELARVLPPSEYQAFNAWVASGDHIPRFRVLSILTGGSRYASGWLGQYLDVVPSKNIVAVRMRRATPSDYANPGVEANAFPTFLSRVSALVP